MDFYAAVHSASAEEEEASRNSEQLPPPPPIAPRIPTATTSPSLSNLGSSLFSSSPGFDHTGGAYYSSPTRSSKDFESRSRTSSFGKPSESHRPVAQYASAPMTSIKVEDIVVQHSVNILSQADGNCLKSVELANSLRGRISGDILASVKRQYGGLLNLLEEFPSKFIVERVPKSDKVRLTHPTAPPPPPPATTPTYNTSPRSFIPHHPSAPRALGEALRIHHIPNDIPDTTILSECGGSHAVQSITIDRNTNLLGGGRTATIVFRSGTDAFNAYRNLRHRGWLGTVSIAEDIPSAATSVSGMSPPSNNSTPLASPRPYSHPPFHRSGSSSSSCGSGLTSVSNSSMLSGIAGGILSQEYRNSPAGYSLLGSGRSMSNVSTSSAGSASTSTGAPSSTLSSPHSSFVIKSSDSSHVSCVTTSSVARSTDSSPDVAYIESKFAETRVSIAPPTLNNSLNYASTFPSACNNTYTPPPSMVISTPSPPAVEGYKRMSPHLSLNHLGLDKEQAVVLNVLCDPLYVPSSPWQVSASGDAYFLSLIADIMEETFGCVVIAHLKSKLKKKLRLGGSTGVRIGPLKALLKAYPSLFTIVDDKYAQLRRSAHGSTAQPVYHH